MGMNIKELKRALGDGYRICVIDLERCLYRDFGNGFNVEISGIGRANSKKPVTLYLWHGTAPPSCMIVKTAHGVERTADAIEAAADELYEFTEQLVKSGCTDRESLRRIKLQNQQ